MTSEGTGEVFKGDSADMCARKFPLVSMEGGANGHACADGERGPPKARAEFPKMLGLTPYSFLTKNSHMHALILSQILNLLCDRQFCDGQAFYKYKLIFIT
jgi:hypothetical protein